MTVLFKDGIDEFRRAGLALGAGNADDDDAAGREEKDDRSEPRPKQMIEGKQRSGERAS